MDFFFSCDWGTTSLRLRLVALPGCKIIAEENSDEGIAAIFNLWKEQKEPEENRFDFYLRVLENKIETLQKKAKFDLEDIPLVISGMASSTIGIIDIPYKILPANANGSDLVTKLVEKTKKFSHDIVIISGVRSVDDVMRGEETQLAGAVDGQAEGLFIFPGTHSKHVWVKEKKIVNVKTYMTGEFFDLLATKSILASSVDGDALFGERGKNSFRKGLQNAQAGNILHESFLVRTNLLFDQHSKQDNFFYLSGLLIGSELKELADEEFSITLVGSEKQCLYYKEAVNALYPEKVVNIIAADQATIRGHYAIINYIAK